MISILIQHINDLLLEPLKESGFFFLAVVAATLASPLQRNLTIPKSVPLTLPKIGFLDKTKKILTLIKSFIDRCLVYDNRKSKLQ